MHAPMLEQVWRASFFQKPNSIKFYIMKQALHIFYTLLVAVFTTFAFSANAQAQEEDFSPYKGIAWGLYFDATGENLMNYMVPVEYVRPTWNKYVLIDFLGCGKDLIVNITDVNEDPEYYDIHLEMDGGLYDDYGYFYAPFHNEPYKWTISAPYGELVGPVYQPGSYYHAPLEYIGLYYVRYPDNYFGYFDIKTQEDFYDDVPRTYITEEEAAIYTDVKSVNAKKNTSSNVYDMLGRLAKPNAKGFTIENGRKTLRK